MATNHFPASIVGRTANGFLARKILTAFGLPEHSQQSFPPSLGSRMGGLRSIPRYLCEILYVFSLSEEAFLSFLSDFFLRCI
jgi:hypothetical protein